MHSIDHRGPTALLGRRQRAWDRGRIDDVSARGRPSHSRAWRTGQGRRRNRRPPGAGGSDRAGRRKLRRQIRRTGRRLRCGLGRRRHRRLTRRLPLAARAHRDQRERGEQHRPAQSTRAGAHRHKPATGRHVETVCHARREVKPPRSRSRAIPSARTLAIRAVEKEAAAWAAQLAAAIDHVGATAGAGAMRLFEAVQPRWSRSLRCR